MESNKKEQALWNTFKEKENLSVLQLEKFQKYSELLLEWNEKFNLTAITHLKEIVSKHFLDSLMISKYVDLNKLKVIADIGPGAGFPGIPLKIMYPHLGMILIEVNQKKISFLREVISQLGLENIEICSLDWRTFLRKTEGNIDYFVSRAVFDPVELCRMFKPACPYKNSKLVYWASNTFVPDKKIEEFILDIKSYKLGYMERKLFFMGLK